MLNFEKLPRFSAFQVQILSRIPEWEEIFKVNREAIESQIYYAHGWADNNPKKAPKKNMMRYLYNWMLIAKRKGTLNYYHRPVPKPLQPEPESDMSYEDMVAIRRKNFPQFKADPVKFPGAITTEEIKND